jgi:hypothetical protein
MHLIGIICFVCLAMFFGLVIHSESGAQAIELKEFPLDSLDGLITRSDVHIDRAVSSDGKGSLRITVTEPTVIRLFEVTDLDVENARLIYTARLRTEGLEGQAYLEMLCYFPGKGEFFSRSLQSPLTGTTEWTTEATPFFLRKGESPEYVNLNLVINGKGTVWVDDVHLLKGPFR